jgi:aminopeptidase
MEDHYAERLAELLVGFGANVQPDQIVSVNCEPGKEPYARAVAASAYKHGARFVDVSWFDPWVKRARIEHAREETLDFVPPWYGDRMIALGEHRAARIGLSGPIAPGLLDDLDPARAGRDQLPMLKESGKLVGERTTNWTIGPAPTLAWARLVHPDMEPGDALAALTRQLEHVLRLDTDDPLRAWRERADTLVAVAERLTARRFDALRYEGPGTDFTVGLLPSAAWQAARFTTVDGVEHMPNLPTEEVFTTPDPARAQGHVTSTKPLVLLDGSVVRGLRVRFEGGRAVEIDADEGAETFRTMLGRDDGAVHLGEVALVDGEGRIGALDTIFYDTLLDENAASHLAVGQGFPFVVRSEDDRRRVNVSAIHVDFMIGSSELAISGVTRDGNAVPVLIDGHWQV